MKTLLVYYSFSGNNKLLAQHLQRRIGADLWQIQEPNPRTAFTILIDLIFKRTPKIESPKIFWPQYDQVVLLAPIWAGRIATPLKAFLLLQKDNLPQYSFLTLCGSGSNKNITAELTQLVQHPPTSVLELKINDLLPPEKKNKIRYTSGYKMQKQDLTYFNPEIDRFLQVSQLA